MAAESKQDNPMGLSGRGLAFIEFAAQQEDFLAAQFTRLGMLLTRQHKKASLSFYEQNDICFLVNAKTTGHAASFAQAHGPCACAMGFWVDDAEKAVARAMALGAVSPEDKLKTFPELPAIYGVGGSLIYLVEALPGGAAPYDKDFTMQAMKPETGLFAVDHLTHNVPRGQMDSLAQDFYGKIFNFREIRFFDIQGQQTGLVSRALRSPCDAITIPINEGKGDNDQIEEYLQEYGGAGIQHVALSCEDIIAVVNDLKSKGLGFMPPPPDTYYDMLSERLPHHQEPVHLLKPLGILLDGYREEGQQHPKLLLQIFSENMLGPIFFEIIQRKGDEGFGEGNFQALFESIERDQMARGVLPAMPNEDKSIEG